MEKNDVFANRFLQGIEPRFIDHNFLFRRPAFGATSKQLLEFTKLVVGVAKDEIYYQATGDDAPYGNPDDPNKRRTGIDERIDQALKQGSYRDVQGKKRRIPELINQYGVVTDVGIALANQRQKRLLDQEREHK